MSERKCVWGGGVGRMFSICGLSSLIGVLLIGSFAEVQGEMPVPFRAFGTAVPDGARSYVVPEGMREHPAEKIRARWVVNRQLPPEAKRFDELGYVPYVPNFMDIVFAQSVPRADQLSQTLSYQATPGELTTGALAVYALRSLKDVKVTVDDFRATQGDGVIPAENVDVRSVFSMRRKHGKDHFTFRPLILEKRTGLAIVTGRSQMFYVAVRVPLAAAAGRYVSHARITAKNAGAHTVSLELTVLPFALTPPESLYAFWYDGRGAKEKVRKEMIAMRGCGMNSVMLVYGQDVKVSHEGENVHFDFTDFLDLMKYYQRAGFDRPLIFNLVIDVFLQLSDEQHTGFLHQMNALAAERGWPGFIWNIGDENDARSPEILERARRVLARTNKAVPQDLTKNTLIIPSKSEVYGTDLDIRVWGLNFSQIVVDSTHKAGARLGMYNGTSRWAEDPRDDRYFFGLWTWAIGIKHVEQWVYNVTFFDANQPFNDLLNPASDSGNSYFYCYPGDDGPLPTVGYYGIAEGVNDARYLRTLDLDIERAKGSSSQEARTLATQAAEFLARWRARIDLSPVSGPKGPRWVIRREAEKVPPAEFDDLRCGTVDFILRLRAAMGI